MTRIGDPAQHRPKVLIVCDNDETLLGLRDYLCRAGLDAHATRDLAHASRESASVRALVLFPDDFVGAALDPGLARALTTGTDLLTVIVTGDSQAFESIASERHGACVVLPKPVWVWSILDVLRDHLEA